MRPCCNSRNSQLALPLGIPTVNRFEARDVHDRAVETAFINGLFFLWIRYANDHGRAPHHRHLRMTHLERPSVREAQPKRLKGYSLQILENVLWAQGFVLLTSL